MKKIIISFLLIYSSQLLHAQVISPSRIDTIKKSEDKPFLIDKIFNDTTDHNWVIKTAVSRYNLKDYTLMIEKSISETWALEIGGGWTSTLNSHMRFREAGNPGYTHDYGFTAQSSIRWYFKTSKQLSGFAFELMGRYSTYNGILNPTQGAYTVDIEKLSKKFKHMSVLLSYQNQLGKYFNYRAYTGLGVYQKLEQFYTENDDGGIDRETGNIYRGYGLEKHTIRVLSPSLKVGIELGIAL